MQEGHIFEIKGLAIDDSLPVVHPEDLVAAGKAVGVCGAGNALVLLGEGKTTLASDAAGLNGRCLNQCREASKGHNEGGGKHSE